jgi:RNA polymerase sigma-70 factor, ECF subfamily
MNLRGRENRVVESDASLVKRARSGEHDAFSLLVQRYERPALAVAMSILHCTHDAGDAVQDACVAAFEQLRRLWSPAKFGGWFLQIVRRQALQQLRRRASQQRKLIAIGADVAQESAQTSEPSSHVDGEIFSLIGRLPDQEALVVSLRHLDERSLAEISQMTGRPIGTVSKQLSRAYARLRSWLAEEGEEVRT